MSVHLDSLYLAQFVTFTLLTAWLLIISWRYPTERALRLWGLAAGAACLGLALLMLRPLLPAWLSVNVALATLLGTMWLTWAGTQILVGQRPSTRSGALLWLGANLAILAYPGASGFGARAIVYGSAYTVFHLLALYALLGTPARRLRFGHRLAAGFIVVQCVLYSARSLLSFATPTLALPTTQGFIWLNLAASWGEYGKLLALVFIIFETQARRLQAHAEHDPLTGLLNRRGFDHRTVRGLDNTAVAVLMMDLDHFKQVNDRFGHACGDEVLVHVARQLETCLAPHGALLARTGGEEFVALLQGSAAAHAAQLAQDLCQQMRASRIGTARIQVTLSIGVARREIREAVSIKALLLDADMALYQAKADGRDRVHHSAANAAGLAQG